MVEKINIIKKKYYIYKNFKKDVVENILTIKKIKINKKNFLLAPITLLEKKVFLNEKKAIELITKYIYNKKKIGIYGDYDADGITGIAVAVSILKKLGANVTYYVNNRFEEGFGISEEGINELKQKKVDLIITVDTGTNSAKEIKKIKKLGIEIIITDHHEPNQNIENTIIINPKQKKCKYLNKEITGVGVIFKILLRVCEKYNKKNMALKHLDLVALGTVADLGNLLGENRIIVKNGLKLLNWEKARISFKILKKILFLKKEITSHELGFVFGPILNSESRLYGKPNLAIKLLIDNNFFDINKNAKRLIEMNKERKKLTEQQINFIEKNINFNKNLLFVYDNKIKEGMAGLIASRFLEKYKKPVIILGKDIFNNIKGSGRSIEQFSLKKNLDEIKKLLITYGGHSLACGLTFKEKNLEKIKKLLEDKAERSLKNKFVFEKIYFDMEIKIKNINDNFFNKIFELEPFGKGFERPNFLIRNIETINLEYLQNKHSKFIVSNIEFICFNQLLEQNKFYNFGGFLNKNFFKNKESIQFIIKHVLELNILIKTKKNID